MNTSQTKTPMQAWLRLYACMVARTETEFCRAYYSADTKKRKCRLWEKIK